jgi:hypothetical protein
MPTSPQTKWHYNHLPHSFEKAVLPSRSRSSYSSSCTSITYRPTVWWNWEHSQKQIPCECQGVPSDIAFVEKDVRHSRTGSTRTNLGTGCSRLLLVVIQFSTQPEAKKRMPSSLSSSEAHAGFSLVVLPTSNGGLQKGRVDISDADMRTWLCMMLTAPGCGVP